MKILVVSLLRLGDVIMTAPVIQGLRSRYPDAQIDFLINRQCEGAGFLFPQIRRFHLLDRELLQSGLGQADRPILESYDRLRSLVKTLASEKYDLVVNLTQNRLSAHLMDVIPAAEKVGMTINQGTGEVVFGSAWFQYVNDVSAAGAKSIFHYCDVFQMAMGVEGSGYQFAQQVEKSVATDGSLQVLVQVTTSDRKKNIDLGMLKEALKLFQISNPNAQVRFLATEAEAANLELTAQDLVKSGVRASVDVVDLRGILSRCQAADLILTTDTSIKHIAAGTDIAILELALGSSDPRKTGAYKSGAYILQSREACAPCDHRKECHRSSHVCAETIPAELVSVMMGVALRDDRAGAITLADEYSDKVEIMRTHFSAAGFWHADILRSTARPDVVDEWLDLTAWRFYLNRLHLKNLAPYGSESLKVREMLERSMSAVDRVVLRLELNRIEGEVSKSEGQIHQLISEVSRRIHSGLALPGLHFIDDELLGQIRVIEQEMDLGDSVSARITAHRGAGIRSIRAVQNALNEIFNHQQIKLKLVRTLKSQMAEKI